MYESSNPKQRYQVLNHVQLNNNQQRVLVKLYQPLIGGVAVSLYQTLMEDFDSYQMVSDSPGLYNLQEQLDCSLKQVFDSLHKLEATGLIKTFVYKNVHLGEMLAFKLKEVPDASEFFATSLLASLLKEKIGGYRFSQLSREFSRLAKKSERKIAGLEDVSASFFDVFRLPAEEAITPSEEVQQAAEENAYVANDNAKVNTKRIDWQFLIDSFTSQTNLPSEEISHQKDEIQSIMEVYGLTEQEFVNEALPTLHGSDHLELDKVRKSLTYNYKAEHRRKQVNEGVSESEIENKNYVSDLNTQDQKLLTVAKEKAPSEFLNYVKKEKGGFATTREYQVINNLSWKVGFKPELINILIYTCLNYQPVLTDSLAERIANDWLRNKVATPEAAVKYIRNYGQRKKKQTSKKANYSRMNKRVEKGTDWSKKKADTSNEVPEEKLRQIFRNFGK